MKFCDMCGSRMREEKKDYFCPKCGNIIHVDARMPSKNVKKIEYSGSVYVVNKLQDEYARVSQNCPECGNKEAFHWYSGVSGEHAGIKREITVEHFRCTKCSHTWSKTS